MNQTDFETLLPDASKRIPGDISWVEDEDHSPAVEFRAEIISDAGYPVFVKGSYNACHVQNLCRYPRHRQL
jgi:hypothetical protein